MIERKKMQKKMSSALSRQQPDTRPVGKVWDIPLRLFHWLLMLAVIGAIASGKTQNWFWHEKMGLTVLGLIGFRLIWGVVGTRYARFSSFRLMPRHVIDYIRSRLAGDKSHSPGHAPTGAWATILLLAVLGGMAGFGTMAHNDVLFEGPLAAITNGYGAGGFSDTATDWHNALEPVMFAMLAVHIVALLMYRIWLKINLVPAMITGGVTGDEEMSLKPFSKTHQITGVILLLAMIAAAQCLGLIGERYYF